MDPLLPAFALVTLLFAPFAAAEVAVVAAKDPVAAPPTALSITRFWHPYDLPDWGQERYVCNEFTVQGDSVWTVPVLGTKGEILEIFAPEFQTHRHRFEYMNLAASIAITPDAIWMQHSLRVWADEPKDFRLVRRDRRSGQDQVYQAPCAGQLYFVNGRLFHAATNPAEGRLREFDEKKEEFRLLGLPGTPSSPPPFRDVATWTLAGIIAGPGGAPCVVSWDAPRGIFAVGGKWERIAAPEGYRVCRFGEKSLIAGRTGDGMFIDPARPEPEWWIAGEKSSAAARQQAKWTCPLNFCDGLFNLAALGDGELFATRRDNEGRHLLRWWYEAGPKEGVEIPLRFDLPDADWTALARHSQVIRDLEGVANPDLNLKSIFNKLSLFTLQTGLVLTTREHGFWYLPYTDLQKYRETRRGRD